MQKAYKSVVKRGIFKVFLLFLSSVELSSFGWYAPFHTFMQQILPSYKNITLCLIYRSKKFMMT